MKNVLVALTLLAVTVVVLCACRAGAEDKKPADDQDKASLWMKKKLEFTQKILTGLTKGDFDLIKDNAEAMQVVGYLEKSDRANLPGYRQQTQYFDDANKELIRQAKAKNVNGATLAYTQLTLSCVQCHSILRDAKK
jgi:cytochrome c556